MALIACSECGAQVSDTAKTCPKCGATTSAGARNHRMKQLAVVVITIGVLYAIGQVMYPDLF